MKKMTVIYSAVIFFVGLDRFLKALAFSGQDREFNLIGEILKFSYKKNYYIAFSLPLAGPGLEAAILVIILLLIYYLVKGFRRGEQLLTLSLSVIILGASSNLFDRFKYGLVIDYLDLKYFTVFNLADAMIVIGVILLLLKLNKKEAV